MGVGVNAGCVDTSGDADCTAQDGEEQGFAQELDTDMASGGAEGTTQAYFTSASQDADEHHIANPDRPDEEGDRTEAKEKAVEGAFGVCLGEQGGGGL